MQQHAAGPWPSRATTIGLLLALFGGPAFVAVFRIVTGESHSNLQLIVRELCLLLLAVVLLWLIRTREHLPLTSVGLHTDRIGRSLVRGVVLTVVALAATVGLYLSLKQAGIRLGEGGSEAFHPSLWVVTLVMLRAGVAEELFYRGYAIERLQALSGSRRVAAIVPLVVFAAAHYRQGVGGIIATFVLGAIFTMAYLRWRDLIANMSGHFLGDFVLNVGVPLMGAG